MRSLTRIRKLFLESFLKCGLHLVPIVIHAITVLDGELNMIGSMDTATSLMARTRPGYTSIDDVKSAAPKRLGD